MTSGLSRTDEPGVRFLPIRPYLTGLKCPRGLKTGLSKSRSAHTHRPNPDLVGFSRYTLSPGSCPSACTALSDLS